MIQQTLGIQEIQFIHDNYKFQGKKTCVVTSEMKKKKHEATLKQQVCLLNMDKRENNGA
jgi:hypothetical protein